MSDGSIVFETRLDKKSLERDLKDVESKIGKVFKKIEENKSESNNKIRAAAKQGVGLQNSSTGESMSAVEVQNRAKALDAERVELQKQLNELRGQETELSNQLATAKQQEADEAQRLAAAEQERESRMAEITAEIDKQNSTLDKLLEKQKKMAQTGVSETSQQWKNNQYEISKTVSKLEELNRKLQEVKGSSNTNLSNRLKGISSSFADMGKSASLSSEQISSVVGGQLKNTMNTFLSFGTMIKSRLKRMIVSGIINTIRDGFTNLMEYNSAIRNSINGLQSSIGTLGNNIAAAFAPLISIVAPILATFINWISDAIAVVTRFFAILGGKSTYTKAIQGVNKTTKAVGGTGGAAKDSTKAIKEEQKALAGFDEIEILSFNKDNGSGSGGGGGGTGGAGSSMMFEEVPVGDISFVADKLKEIADLFKKGFFDGIGDDFKKRIGDIKKNLLSIKDTIIEIATDPGVAKSFDEMFNAFIYNIGVFTGSLASIGITIAQLLVGGIAKGLEYEKEYLKNVLANLFNTMTITFNDIGSFASGFAEIFASLGSEGAQSIIGSFLEVFDLGSLAIINILIGFADSVFKFLIAPFTGENSKYLRTICDQTFQVIANIIKPISDTIAGVIDNLNTLWSTSVKPTLDSMAEAFGELCTTIYEMWLQYIEPALNAIGDVFQDTWLTYVEPAIDDFMSLFDSVISNCADLIKWFWNDIAMPTLQWFTSTFAPLLSLAVTSIGTVFSGTFGAIGALLSGFTQSLNGVIQFIQGVFTGNWRQAWEGIKNIFRGVVNGVIGMAEAMANAVVGAMNKLSFTVPDIIPGIGGKHVGFNLGRVSLPRLATGTVVPPNAGEFAAILGDNKHETEVVSPLSTIKQAMMEALVESGMNQSHDAYLERIIEILLKILEKDPTISISEIIDALKRKNQRDGKTIIPVG